MFMEIKNKNPANTRRSPNVGTMLGHCLQCWANTVRTLAERLVFAENISLSSML